ncbi:MAG: putative transcriptional regulator [Actinomycetia bacterium]|nr:putative transcriptional regulator [Actinomycetes bacterium]
MSRADDLAGVDAALTRISRVANSRRAARYRAQLSGVDLLPTGVATLAAIVGVGPARLTDVSAHLELEPSRVSKEVNRLVEAGFVTQQPDPSDRRAVLLTVTDEGADAWRRYRKATDKQLARTLDDWSDDDLHHLADQLRRLSAAVAGEPL